MGVGKSMSSEENAESGGLADIFIKPSITLSKWYIAIGVWGLTLAILNSLGYIHPTYRVSWGGLLTFEAFADAFGHKDDAPAFVVGDLVFMGACLALLGLGLNSINKKVEGGVRRICTFARHERYVACIGWCRRWPHACYWSMVPPPRIWILHRIQCHVHDVD